MKRLTTSYAELKNFIKRTLVPTIKSTFKYYGFKNQENDVEEVLSITLEKISSNLHSYSEEKSSNMWFVTIAKNAAITYMKEYNKKGNVISLDSYSFADDDEPISETYMQIPASDSYASDYNLKSKENLTIINNVISSMSMDDAHILRMLLNGYTKEDICKVLNLTDGACRTKLSRIRSKFRKDPRIISLCNEFKCTA